MLYFLGKVSLSALIIALSTTAYSQNIDGRINGFANNKNKVVISKGAALTFELSAIDSAQASNEIKDFQKEADKDIRRRGDENVAWLFWRDGKLIHETYHQKVKPENYFLGFSITKSVVSVAIGTALCEGKLSLTDLPVKYLPELTESAYANRTIEDLLLMKSGIPFQEVPNAEIVFRDAFFQSDTYDATLLRMSAKDFTRSSNPNWNYDSNNTEVLGRVLHAATGGLEKYIGDMVWSKIGPQADAWFAVDKENRPLSGGGLYAQPRDYLRLGVHMLNLTSADNTNACLRDYMLRATSPLTTIRQDDYYGYGYQVWSKNNRLRNSDDTFELKGFFGQRVVVDKKTKSVAVAISTREGDLARFYSLVNKLRTLPLSASR